jgi:hypothetical protein
MPPAARTVVDPISKSPVTVKSPVMVLSPEAVTSPVTAIVTGPAMLIDFMLPVPVMVSEVGVKVPAVCIKSSDTDRLPAVRVLLSLMVTFVKPVIPASVVPGASNSTSPAPPIVAGDTV